MSRLGAALGRVLGDVEIDRTDGATRRSPQAIRRDLLYLPIYFGDADIFLGTVPDRTWRRANWLKSPECHHTFISDGEGAKVKLQGRIDAR